MEATEPTLADRLQSAESGLQSCRARIERMEKDLVSAHRDEAAWVTRVRNLREQIERQEF